MEEYMDLLAFVERVSKADRKDTHHALVLEARRLLGSEYNAEVHLENECIECQGAGWFDNSLDSTPEPSKCEACEGTGNALRPLPAIVMPPRSHFVEIEEQGRFAQ